MICPNCGRENNDNNNFCSGCGMRFSATDTMPDERTVPDTGYDFSSIENEETMFLGDPAPGKNDEAPAAGNFVPETGYDMESLENEETMILTDSRRHSVSDTSDVPDFSYRGNVPVFKEGEGIKNPQPAQNVQPQRPQQVQHEPVRPAQPQYYAPAPDQVYARQEAVRDHSRPAAMPVHKEKHRAGSSRDDSFFEKIPGCKNGGSLFIKLAGVSVLALTFTIRGMIQSAVSSVSDAINSLEMPDLSGLTSMSYGAVICYVCAVIFGIGTIVELCLRNKKRGRNIFADARLWMAAVMLILTFMSYSTFKAATMSLDVMNGSFSLDMIGDAFSIGMKYRTTKSVLTMNAVLAVAAIVVDIIMSSKGKSTAAASPAAMSPAQAPYAAQAAPMQNMQPQRPQQAPVQNMQPQRPQAAPMQNVQTQMPQAAPMQNYQPASPAAQPADNAGEPEYMSQLRGLRQLLDDGIITEEEFENKKKFLLGL